MCDANVAGGLVPKAAGLAIVMLSSVDLAIAATAPTSPEALASGKQVFVKQCAPCHGSEGRGDGEAAYLLYPRPRNFHPGRFRLVSTWEGVPSDDDLFQTISRGMPGLAASCGAAEENP
jgi:Cytochrome c